MDLPELLDFIFLAMQPEIQNKKSFSKKGKDIIEKGYMDDLRLCTKKVDKIIQYPKKFSMLFVYQHERLIDKAYFLMPNVIFLGNSFSTFPFTHEYIHLRLGRDWQTENIIKDRISFIQKLETRFEANLLLTLEQLLVITLHCIIEDLDLDRTKKYLYGNNLGIFSVHILNSLEKIKKENTGFFNILDIIVNIFLKKLKDIL